MYAVIKQRSFTVLLYRYWLLAFIALPFTLPTKSLQAQPLDSLYAIWKDPTAPDSTRANAYYDYIWNGYLFTNPDSAFILTEELIAFGQQQNYREAEARGINLQGSTIYLQGDYAKALTYYERSLKVSEEIRDQKGYAGSLNNIGIIYNARGDYAKAFGYFSQSLKIQRQLGNKKGVSNALNNLGNIYNNQGDYPKALEYYTQSLKIKEELEDQMGIANSLNNIGMIYNNQGDYAKALEYNTRRLEINEQMGDQMGIANSLNNIGINYEEQGDYAKALTYHTQSLKIKEELGDQSGIASSLTNIGLIYANQGDYSKALDYYTRSLKIDESLGNQKEIAISFNNIGTIYTDQGNHSKALGYYQKGYELAVSIDALKQQKEGCQYLYDTYKAMGNGPKALEYYELLNVIKDSLDAEETGKKLQQMEFAKQVYQDSIATAEKERLMEEAHLEEVRKKNQTRNILAGGGLFLILLAGGLFARVRYIRKSKAVLQVEKDRSENLLLNILPEEIAHELKIYGKAEARDFDLVSILFTDFKGFTEHSAKLTAAELVNEINHCFEAFDGIMEKYGIEKIKTIGDAYMAAGGLPIPTDDSVKNTVLAALEMQAFITQRKTEMDAVGNAAFEMRVGIHTGPVVAGIVGVKKFQYDIWGDTVNTAARMESHGAVGKVNISEATYTILRDLAAKDDTDPQFAFESRGKIAVKGKGEIEMWFVSLT